MEFSIYARYAKDRLETARQHSILHPERIVGNREVASPLPRFVKIANARFQRAPWKRDMPCSRQPKPGTGLS
jgi:hypothetical protein